MKQLFSFLFACLFAGCGQVVLNREVDAQQAMCEEAITGYILSTAVYPASYENGGFDEFSTGSVLKDGKPVEGTGFYALRHTHRMRSAAGDTVTFTGYFVLDDHFGVSRIERERSGLDPGAEPDLKVWTDLFVPPPAAPDTVGRGE